MLKDVFFVNNKKYKLFLSEESNVVSIKDEYYVSSSRVEYKDWIESCNRTIFIHDLEVTGSLRNNGFATRMINCIIDHFTIPNTETKFELYCEKDNYSAISLYRKLGFRIVGDFSTNAYCLRLIK